MGNFIKASYAAITATYGFLTPDLWTKIEVCPSIPPLSRSRAGVLISPPLPPLPPAALAVALRGVLVPPPARRQEGLLNASLCSGCARSLSLGDGKPGEEEVVLRWFSTSKSNGFLLSLPFFMPCRSNVDVVSRYRIGFERVYSRVIRSEKDGQADREVLSGISLKLRQRPCRPSRFRYTPCANADCKDTYVYGFREVREPSLIKKLERTSERAIFSFLPS